MKSIGHRPRHIAGNIAVLCALFIPITVLVSSVTEATVSADAILLVSICSFALLVFGMVLVRGARSMRSETPATTDSLAAGIAQDINNPNHTIRANASLMSAVWLEIEPILKEYRHENGDFLIAGMSYEEICALMPVYLENLLAASRRIETVVGNLPDSPLEGDVPG
jgi:hypothetical protein